MTGVLTLYVWLIDGFLSDDSTVIANILNRILSQCWPRIRAENSISPSSHIIALISRQNRAYRTKFNLHLGFTFRVSQGGY